MTKFVTGEALEKAVYDIIWEARETLMIVSPYIKLDDYFKRLFDKHQNNPNLHILIVFGKNEDNRSRSLNKNDFDFFTKFLNISIVYEPNLHAKYYGNEKNGVITSINLYDYSFKTNIEFGVFSETSFYTSLTSSPDKEAWITCWEVANNGNVVFIKRPVYDKNILSSLIGKNYVKSDVLFDSTDEFYRRFDRKHISELKKLAEFPSELKLGSDLAKRPSREEFENLDGFCIRTGVKIKFNPKRPFCDEAFRSWSQFENFDYPEKYCHKTGKKSYGNTSMRNPILKDTNPVRWA